MSNLNKMRILCLDNDPVSGRYLKRIIENSDGVFYFTQDLKEAQGLMLSFRPQIVLLGEQIEGVNCLEILKNEKLFDLSSGSIILMLTTDTSIKKEELEFEKYGVKGHLSKPLNAKEIVSKLSNYIKTKKAVKLKGGACVKALIKASITNLSEDRVTISSPVRFYKGTAVVLEKQNIFGPYIKFCSSSDSLYEGVNKYSTTLFISGASSDDIKNLLILGRNYGQRK